MSRTTKARRPRSIFRLTVTQRLLRSWTSWRIRKVAKAKLRADRKLRLLQLELDSQLLRQKLLEQREQLLLLTQQELREAEHFRLKGELPPPPERPPNPEMDRLLGISPR